MVVVVVVVCVGGREEEEGGGHRHAFIREGRSRRGGGCERAADRGRHFSLLVPWEPTSGSLAFGFSTRFFVVVATDPTGPPGHSLARTFFFFFFPKATERSEDAGRKKSAEKSSRSRDTTSLVFDQHPSLLLFAHPVVGWPFL